MEENPRPPGMGVRQIQYVLLFTATLMAYALRVCFHVAIVAMVSTETVGEIPIYPEWAEKKNIMISSFFWGYVPPQVLAGQLAKNYGAKWFLGGTTLLGAIFSILIPPFTELFGYPGVIICRIIQGIGQSFLYPCVHTLLSKWTPVESRAQVGSFVYAGIPLGTVLSMPITGYCSKYEMAGWPVSFYIFGVMGIVWFILWAFLSEESPAEHKTISATERKYIEYGSHSESNRKNSLLSSLPYLAFWIITYIMGNIADLLIRKKLTSRTTSRKIFTSIVAALLALNAVGSSNRAVVIFLLTVSVGATGGVFSGHYINHIDLSPNYAGALMGITTMASNFCALMAPLSVDLFIYLSGYQETDKELWIIVFFEASAVYLLTGSMYALFASAELQPWNSPDGNE
ncbi:hypothetical protein NQ314_017449 [Rhamnusium bicolor]|uniref:Putative inorganic phosphate cotransporter n=1 Tax=Rhamnusium bicolor TaxID=1586634 RepID=A0AAV8WT35_9CUCU|nr:hypothetical protein NQ314_017449 [Rhamnusium bicolor]